MFENGIPTEAVWKTRSSAGLGRRRSNPLLLDVDKKVKAYENVLLTSPTLQQRFESLVELYEAIELYLASKGGSHSESRTNAAKALKSVVLKELTKIRWQKLREIHGGGRGRMLDSRTWSEFHDNQHTRVGMDYDAWIGDDTAERFLFQNLRTLRRMGQTPDTVVYVEDEERWRFLVVFDADGKMYKRPVVSGREVELANVVLDTQGASIGTAIYAVDLDGNFYVDTGTSTRMLNHCSFLAGKPVLCAGEIGVKMGELEYIDTGSGHYRPKTRDMIKALEALHERRVNLFGVIVRVFDKKWNDAVYEAGKFLTTRGNCRAAGTMNDDYRKATIFIKDSDFVTWASAHR